jgi:hypothetical protein
MNIGDLLKDKNHLLKAFYKALERKYLNVAKQLIPLINNPKITYDFVIFHNKGNYEKSWESIILTSPQYAYLWAKDIRKSRWEEAEDIISQSPWYSYLYANDVLKDRFPKGEATILTDPLSAYSYAYSVIKGRWEEAEPLISQNSTAAFYYAFYLLNSPFEAGEDAIAQDPFNSYYYAKNVIKGRFKKGEKRIIEIQGLLEGYLFDLKEWGLLNEFLKDYPHLKPYTKKLYL